MNETTAALRSDDPHVAALHVELATCCVRNALAEREREVDEAPAIPLGPAAA